MDCFCIIKKDKKTNARIGLLKTKKGNLETPVFMPVATKASVKYLSSEDLKKIRIKAIISNTFILHLKPGEKLIKELGGIGKFMNFYGINVTDSGGFQMYNPACYIDSNDKGVFFRNPFTKQKLFITPEKDMEIQLDLNSEIAMCLDSMPLLCEPKEKIAEAVRKTVLWAKKCKKHHDQIQENIQKSKRQLLFAISQGGVYPDLRKKCCEQLLKLNFDGYAIGGLALGETKEQEYNAIETHKSVIPEDKICYLMGAGHPLEILEAISRGVDMFDSKFLTQNARRGTIFTSQGKINLFNSKYAKDSNPLDKNCKCFVCNNYSKAYIRYGLKMEEGNARRLASYHNIYYITNLIENAKKAIKKGNFLEFKEKTKKIYNKTDDKIEMSEENDGL
ncbi:MAG: tRNA guanosine(34) transglycosylase Tgt [Candidatus Pacearchaeota archaeon]